VLALCSCSRNRGGYDMMLATPASCRWARPLLRGRNLRLRHRPDPLGVAARSVAAVDVWRLSGTRGRARRDCLRVHGIALRHGDPRLRQAFYFLVESNPHNLTGGDTGLSLTYTRLPSFLSGAVSTRETSTDRPRVPRRGVPDRLAGHRVGHGHVFVPFERRTPTRRTRVRPIASNLSRSSSPRS